MSACTCSGGVPGDIGSRRAIPRTILRRARWACSRNRSRALRNGLPGDRHHQPVDPPAAGAARKPVVVDRDAGLPQPNISPSWRPVRAFGGSGPEWRWKISRLYTMWTNTRRRRRGTYPAHVILRYRLERALIDGDLPLADLPGAWNDAMEDLLERPPDDRQGCRIYTGMMAPGAIFRPTRWVQWRRRSCLQRRKRLNPKFRIGSRRAILSHLCGGCGKTCMQRGRPHRPTS